MTSIFHSAKNYPREEYGALFDAHVHTYFDLHDALMSPEQLIRATKKWGFNWINAMAHDSLRGMPYMKKLAKEANLPLVPAMEISTGINHILAFGVQEWKTAKDCWNPEVLIDELRKQDCAIYLSHPMLNTWRGKWTPEIVKRLDVDGIEWVNGSAQVLNHLCWNDFKYYPKGKIGGTDAHHPSNMGFTYTQVDTTSTDVDDLVKTLQQGKCRPQGRYTPVHRAGLWALYITLRKKFYPQRKILDKWILPNDNQMGWQPQNFNPELWHREILKQQILTPFNT